MTANAKPNTVTSRLEGKRAGLGFIPTPEIKKGQALSGPAPDFTLFNRVGMVLLGSHLPGAKVFHLFRGEGVDGDADGLEFQAGDFIIDLLGHRIDLFFEGFRWFFTTNSAPSAWLAKLISITEAGWPSAAARLIRRPSPRTLPSTVSAARTLPHRRALPGLLCGDGRQAVQVQFDVEVPGVANHRPLFIFGKCSLRIT